MCGVIYQFSHKWILVIYLISEKCLCLDYKLQNVQKEQFAQIVIICLVYNACGGLLLIFPGYLGPSVIWPYVLFAMRYSDKIWHMFIFSGGMGKCQRYLDNLSQTFTDIRALKLGDPDKLERPIRVWLLFQHHSSGSHYMTWCFKVLKTLLLMYPQLV